MEDAITTKLADSTIASEVRVTIASTKRMATGRKGAKGAQGKGDVSLATRIRADKAKNRKTEAVAAVAAAQDGEG